MALITSPYLYNVPFSAIRNEVRYSELWIGLMDFTGDNADYQWISDGDSLGNFNNWATNQPNSDDHQCVTIFGLTMTGVGTIGEWNDNTCDQAYGAICETSMVSQMSFLRAGAD